MSRLCPFTMLPLAFFHSASHSCVWVLGLPDAIADPSTAQLHVTGCAELELAPEVSASVAAVCSFEHGMP